MPGPTAAAPAVGRLAGAAALIAVLTVLSRLAGFGRTAVFGWTVSATSLGDMYLAVNAVPNVVFEVVAGGALASLVVPLLAGAVAAGDRDAVAATASALLTWVLTLLVPLAVLVALLAGPIVRALAGADASPAELDTGVRMLRVFAPQLPLYGVGVVLTGVLQAHRRFAWPVLAPLLSSLTVIGVYLAFAAVAGRGADIGTAGRCGELILSVGTTLGVAVLSLCLVPPARRLGLRLRPTYALPPDTRRTVGGLAAAGAVAVTAQQLALLVQLRLALAGPDGANVRFFLAQAVYLLPWAVLAVPVATAAYPALAEAGARSEARRFAGLLAPAARAVILLGCLGAAALVAVADPAARLLLDDAADRSALAAGIVGFAPGLLGYGLSALLSRALYARGALAAASVATAAGWALVAVAAAGLAAALAPAHRVVALTLGNSAGMLLLGAALVVAVLRRCGPAALSGLGRAAAAGVPAGALAALAGLAAGRLAGMLAAGTPAPVAAVAQGMLSGIAVGLVFVAVAYPLDRRDVRPLLARGARAVRRRLRGGRTVRTGAPARQGGTDEGEGADR
ncbi:MAG TPA: lipid II flippase MurJ [Pilimelia sp.]|nr:lipid II flippase MurJ [Pilimelia sp.]